MSQEVEWAEAEGVRRTAFQLLFAEGRAVSVAEVARAAGCGEAPAGRAVEQLVGRGAMRRRPDGCIVGAGGLSVEPTRHEVRVDGRRFWTWCAYDAFGILGALARGGVVISTSPLTGRVIEAEFDGAVPSQPALGVFIASAAGCRSVVDDWCPLNNLFEDVESARAWAAANGVEGEALDAARTAEVGGERWRRMFAADPLQR